MSEIHENVREMLSTDVSADRLGVVTTAAADGRATVRMTVEASMANGLGVAQGGFVFALADHAFACAANSVAPGTATVEAAISYLSPARVGDELVAEASVSYSDDRRIVADVVVRAGDRVVALFRATGRAMRPSR